MGSSPNGITEKPAPGAGFVVSEINPDKIPDKIEDVLKFFSEDVDYMKPYKKAIVYIGPTESFVYFSWWSKKDKKYIRVKKRTGSKGLTPKEKKLELQNLADILNEFIRKRNKAGIYHEEIVDNIDYEMSLIAWIDKILAEKKEGSTEFLHPESTRVTTEVLKSHIAKFCQFTPQYNDCRTNDLNELWVKKFASYLQHPEPKKFISGKTVNNYLWSLSFVFKQISKYGLKLSIDVEQFRVKHVKNESGKYPPLTSSEKDLVFNFYREHNPKYYLFLLHIYYTCIRPKELHRLQAKFFDFKNNTIFTPWFTTKNGLSNYVQMLAPLKRALVDMGIDKLPQNHFIFGNNFEPSSSQYTGNTISSDYWRIYRERIGIPITKQQYGLKHTFNKDYVENNKGNIDWEWLRRHNRHATVQQTQQYISELTAYFIDETKITLYDYHPESPKLP